MPCNSTMLQTVNQQQLCSHLDIEIKRKTCQSAKGFPYMVSVVFDGESNDIDPNSIFNNGSRISIPDVT